MWSRAHSSEDEHLPEMKLWDDFRAGSDAAYVEIYETHFEQLYAYGIRISGSKTLVKDCIHEVFIDLKELRRKLGPTDSIKFYLFKCLKRKLYRELNRWDKRVQSFNTEGNFEFSVSPEQLLIEQQIDEEARKKLNQALEQLSPRRKEIIYYFFFEGLSYEQTQEIMGLENVKTTRNLMYKTLGFLRDILK
ncbi:RNA polymerase sigma factor [Negadavirga shengliensis]|uniref:RNA polymerase sigma factor n=1 Tax=Negadavirga shengliensis TaxID=1389218 RepID=A0ABV9SXA0_9BACT